MSANFSNAETNRMFQMIDKTCPTQLKSDAQEALVGYLGLHGIAAEIKSEYSITFSDEFTEQELEKVQWQEIAEALAAV